MEGSCLLWDLACSCKIGPAAIWTCAVELRLTKQRDTEMYSITFLLLGLAKGFIYHNPMPWFVSGSSGGRSREQIHLSTCATLKACHRSSHHLHQNGWGRGLGSDSEFDWFWPSSTQKRLFFAVILGLLFTLINNYWAKMLYTCELHRCWSVQLCHVQSIIPVKSCCIIQVYYCFCYASCLAYYLF